MGGEFRSRSVLVTGATGTLGKALVARFAGADCRVRALSRSPNRGSSPAVAPSSNAVSWVVGDLASGQGIETACQDVEVVVHSASDGRTRQGDVGMTRRILEAAGREGCHVVYISIVGVDRLPFGYYQAKLDAENLIVASGLPYTILRATQFHDLLFRFLSTFNRSPIVPVLAGLRFQPIDADEVAERLVNLALAPPVGRAPDMGGPEVRLAADLAHAYLKARHRRRLVLPLPLPGKVARGFQAGLNLTPDHAVGRRTWEQYLAARLGGAAS